MQQVPIPCTFLLIPLVSGWIVTLDGRMMKTPDENRFLLPTEELAYLVAGEWEAQDTKIRPITMPMVSHINNTPN